MDNKYIQRHIRNRNKELKYDFMPQMLEIIERPANKAGSIIILGILTLLIVVIVWACLSKMDVVITASGTIQPVGNLNVVQSYSGGSVDAIHVTEGMHVEKGDILIELDMQSLEIDAEQLENQKAILEAQKDIYILIKNGEDVTALSIDEYNEELRTYIQAIVDTDSSYHNELASLELEKNNARLNQQIAQLQLEEYQRTGTQSQQEAQALIVQQYGLVVEQTDLEIKTSETQYSAQINAKLSEIHSQLDEIESNLEKYEVSKEYQQLVAPVSGYVNSIEVNTIGETVATGQDLVTIVPDEMPMEMVCYVQNMDIADVEVGMDAEIKLEAYPYNKFGTVGGTVNYISPSSFMHEELGSVYLVKLELAEPPGNVDIISGLSGSVEIKIGKRTVMDYFMEPIMKGFGESMKEK